jgi:hypothetical protein
VTIVFANSRDVVWYNSPKLRVGEEAVFLARTPNGDDQAELRASVSARLLAQPIYLVTEPYDVVPPVDEARIRTLLSNTKEE